MSFRRKIWYTLLIVLAATPVFAAEQWRIAVAPFQLLSPKDDYNISKILGESITSRLKEVQDFKILSLEAGFKDVEDRADALQQGRLAEADVMIYGSYYIQADRLVFFVEILDVLRDKVKLREYYTGDLSLDLFDTIDEVSAQIVRSVREALPEFTTESEVEINKIRQTVYQSQELKLKRLFYTHIGFNHERGFKDISYIDTNAQSTNAVSYSGRFPSTQLELGLTIRIGNIRFDGSLTGLTGIPGYYPFAIGKTLTTLQGPGFGRISLTWYPGFLKDKYAIGVGLNSYQQFLGTNFHDNSFGIDEGRTLGRSLTLFFFTHAIPNLELEASIKIPVLDKDYVEYISTNDYSENMEKHQLVYDTIWPTTTLSVTWFPWEHLGIKARFYYESAVCYDLYSHYENGTNSSGQILPALNGGGPMIETLSLYLGLVYKADFL